MTPQELKNSILQRAIEGKLVEQRAEEGNAEDLYKKIQAEKQKLIKAGKIKKDRSLPDILDEDRPFDIPDNWMWCRLGTVINLLSGQDMPLTAYNDKKNGVPYITGASNIENGKIIINRWIEKPKTIATRGQLLVTCKGTVGKTAILNKDRVHIARQIMSIETYFLDVNFLKCFIDRQVPNLIFRAKSMIPGIERSDILMLFFPLPPLAEQKRIVAKIEELLPYVDRYEKAWTKLEDFNKRFPVDMQKSVLQMAISGKLVEQRPKEGNVEELYKKIQTEKQKLTKEGKIKKDKPQLLITDEEKPFDIPDSWMWVRFKDVCKIVNGFTPSRSNTNFWNGEIPWFTIDDVHDQGRFISHTKQSITKQALSKNSERIVPPDTVLLCCTASVGEYAYTKISLTTNQQFNALVIRDEYKNVLCPMYLYEFSQTLKKKITNDAGKTTFNFLSVGKLENFLLPIPPLEEQKRIVEKIDELLPHIENIERLISYE